MHEERVFCVGRPGRWIAPNDLRLVEADDVARTAHSERFAHRLRATRLVTHNESDLHLSAIRYHDGALARLPGGHKALVGDSRDDQL